MIVGIDLGTTNSAIGYLSETGPRLIPNAVGGVLTPSVVGVDEHDQILVGQAAKELQVLQPQRCAALFKRLMGGDTPTTIGRRTFSPEQLSSLVLRSLKQDAEAHLQQPIERAVVSVPAYFNEHQRKATLNAGRLAGLDVVRIVNEPTAAAIAYGMHQLTETLRLVVLDLGGGTFDVSVVDLFEGMLEVRASCGESFLGGEDFTRALAAQLLARRGHVFERIEQQAPKLVARTIQQAELAKRTLSREPAAVVRIANEGGELAPDSPGAPVTREEFEQWTASLLSRIELPIRRALGDANCQPSSCDQVLLVGGATRMPMFRRRAEELFGRAPRSDLNPDEVVALGASLQAGLLEQHRAVGDVVVTDVAPFTLGVEITHRVGHELRDGYFLPLINRNTTIPVSRVERVFTVEPNQHHVRVAVYQGEGRKVQDNTLLAEFTVDRLPPGGPRGNQGLDIRFTYDLNGVLEVEVTVVATGKKHQHVVTRHAKGLSPEQLQAALARMAELKLQPREEAAAQLLIRRAERLYQELPLDARERLNQLLSAFESALAESDKAGLEEMRAALEQFLSAWDAPPDVGD